MAAPRAYREETLHLFSPRTCDNMGRLSLGPACLHASMRIPHSFAYDCNPSPHDVCCFGGQALVRLDLDMIAVDTMKRAMRLEKGDADMQRVLDQIQLRLKRTTRKPDT